jgi:uncharacterized C2H2 Zn-finger protein
MQATELCSRQKKSFTPHVNRSHSRDDDPIVCIKIKMN